ncbi:hypothetical protein MMC21_004957 [Puttea exsequens]|nr:hypothetical protein [Puttea exsequens]
MTQRAPDLPQITLENTFAELYQANGKEVIVLPPTLAHGSKYVYQIEQGSWEEGTECVAKNSYPSHAQIKLQALIPQQMSFSVGSLRMIMFNSVLEDCNDVDSMSANAQAQMTLEHVKLEQRPQLILQPDPEHLDRKALNCPLAVCTPIDALDGHRLTIPLDVSYELLTKETLARSTIPGPASRIISVKYAPSKNYDGWINSEVNRSILEVSRHPLPFVLKFTQTISGHGVHIIRTASERDRLCQNILPSALHNHLRQLTPENAYLKPCNLVMTDLITDISANYSLTIFVHCDGHWTFNACGTQHLKNRNGSDTEYAGTSINYRSQDRLKRELKSTIKDIASFVHDRCYYGPVGADVLIDRSGKQQVVDLSVRWTSSWILGTLGNYFLNERRLGCARLVMKELTVGRDDFAKMVEEGVYAERVVIVAWFELRRTRKSWAHLVVGGEGWEEVEGCLEKIDMVCVEDMNDE